MHTKWAKEPMHWSFHIAHPSGLVIQLDNSITFALYDDCYVNNYRRFKGSYMSRGVQSANLSPSVEIIGVYQLYV